MDLGHQMTEKELAALEKRIIKIYKEAADELQEKIAKYFASFKERDKKQQSLLKEGKITEQEYRDWRLAQIGRGKRFEALRDQIAERYTKASEVALVYVNDATPGIYSLNRNYAAYTIEQATGDVGFTLWDEQTTKRLIKERPDLMPYYPEKKALRRGIDLAWGKKQITRQVTSGILLGESIGDLAERLKTNIPGMGKASAIRTARTAVTGAQNAGRMDTYKAAEKMGIELEREWVATLDNRTRHAHQVLDGQTAPINKPFKVDGQKIMYPGDPTAAPYLVYNCRCTLVSKIKGIDMADAKRRARNTDTGRNSVIKGMTYQEWEKQKRSKP